ncbi:MAG: PKD domain-containing protein [Candidatus Eisenbacteria bacterium]
MRRSLLLVAMMTVVAVGSATRAEAQYLYLDANGDGVNSTSDRLSPIGVATTVDVWLRTNANRDGSPAVCSSADGNLTINSYVVNLAASGGTLAFSGFVNDQPAMTTVLQPFASSTTEMTVGRGAGLIFAPGTYRLMTVTVTALTGSPTLSISGPSGLQATDITNFGSACSGLDFDNTLKLGSDWFDADGLGESGTSSNPPVISAPATATGAENAALTLTASASDPDGNPLLLYQTNNAPFLPTSGSVGPIVNPSLSISGIPGFADAGGYVVTWTAVQSASPSLSTSATTAISITDGPMQNPVITAPAVVQGQEFIGVTVMGSATDPDGGNVTLSQTNNAPFFPAASSSSGPAPNPSITLLGTPTFTQAGSYTVNWSAVDAGVPAGTASATTAVTVGGHRNPVILAPVSVAGSESVPLSITASAASPDGAFVTLCVTNLPGFLIGPSCVGPVLNPSITITGTPNATQAGSYTIQWIATDTVAGTAAATTALTISDSNRAPVLDQPVDMAVNEGETATQQLTASDADGNALTFIRSGTSPLFMSVSQTGLVTLTPGYADAGSYTESVMVTDGALTDSRSLVIAVANVNRCPVANAGEGYSGIPTFPVLFDGSGSSDPDGEPLVYHWDFGDHTTGSGVTPTHAYQQSGGFLVTLTVDDGACKVSALTAAAISAARPAVAFTTGGNSTINLGSGRPFNYVQIEPVNGSFNFAEVDFSSVRLVSNGTGVVSVIYAASSKTSVDGDRNGNGVAEIRAGFAKSDLRRLFSMLPVGTNAVTASVEGNIVTGGYFTGLLVLHVKATGGAMAASIAPNPLNPSARLTFATTKPGALRVQLFDLNGRLVRTSLDERQAAAGYHDVSIDGRNSAGQELPSGVYFLKIRTEHDGTETKRFTILK